MDRENWGRDIRKSADPVYYKELKKRAIYNRNHPTESERLMWFILNSSEFKDFKFRRQHIIDRFIVDFVCLSRKLVIEIDGGYHNTLEQLTEDKIRSNILIELGFSVLRFTNQEVFTNLDIVINTINKHLNKTSAFQEIPL